MDDLDVDALLDAESSSDEEEPSRSIEDILHDADDDEEDPNPAVSEATTVSVQLQNGTPGLGNKRKSSSKLWDEASFHHQMVVPRPSPRPGAALAAAAAASRPDLPTSRSPHVSGSSESSSGETPSAVSVVTSDDTIDGTSVVTDADVDEATSASTGKSEDGTDIPLTEKESTPGNVEIRDDVQSDVAEVDMQRDVEANVEIREDAEDERSVEIRERDRVEDVDIREIEEDEVETLVASIRSSEDVDGSTEDAGEDEVTSLGSEGSDTGSTVQDKPVIVVTTKVKSPLEEAEDLESGAANSGLYLEEGAAARPMQLEGIQRGPPAIGLLQLDWKNPLSFTLSSATVVRDHGTPRALAVHGSCIAVGMSKGTVILSPSRYSATRSADGNETKIILLTSTLHAPVTVMSFSFLGDMLLVGYANGTVTLWDVTKATMAKVVTVEHGVVVHAEFIGQDSSKAITADSKGVVLLHTIATTLFRRISVSPLNLLEGQWGAILSLSAWFPDEKAPAHSNGSLSNGDQAPNDVGRKFLFDEKSVLVVLARQQMLTVFRLLPSLEFCANFPRPQGVQDGSIPYTSWRSAPAQTETGESAPILAVAWDQKAFVFHLKKGVLQPLAQWNLDTKAAGIAWLGEEMLAVLTEKAELCVYTIEGAELERAALRDSNGDSEVLSFHTHFIETADNKEKVYANSLGVRGAAIYLLGSSKMWRARLLPWKERIKALQNAGDWMGAFQIAMELYDGKARGVTGLPTGLGPLQQAIAPNLLSLLSAYIDEAFEYVRLATSNGEGLSSEAAREQYVRVGGVAIEFCVHINRTDVLFENVFKKFEAVGQAASFLELLEPYILKDMLNGLAPEIMQSLVEHYSSKGWLQRVEQCILHMDIGSLDFSQVMKLCREHGLFSALIYLFNTGLNDFQSPVEELLAVAQSRPDARHFGYKLLVYLKYCFSGLAFPPGRGSLPPERTEEVTVGLLYYILSPEGSEATIFSRLYYLLVLDAAATLDVLGVAFRNEAIKRNFVQMLVDALVHIVETAGNLETSIVPIFNFLALYVSTKDATIPPTTLQKVLEHLCSSSGSDEENLTLAVLKAAPETDWDADVVLRLAEKASYWQTAALAHTRSGNYAAALESHLKEPSRWHDTFKYIHSLLKPEASLDSNIAAEFRAAVVAHLPQLIQHSREASLFVVLDYFNDQVQDIVKSLESSPNALFYLLRAVMELHSSPRTTDDENARPDADEPWTDRARLAGMLGHSHFHITDEMVEFYFELMCQLEPNSVFAFLKRHENYRLEQCLKLCQKYGVKDGAAYLLEMVGDVGGALSLILENLTGLFHELDKAVTCSFSSQSDIPEVKTIHSVRDAAISLCQRNTFRLDNNEAVALWFHLLDRFVHPLKSLIHLTTSKSHLKPGSSHYHWKVLSDNAALGKLRRLLSKFVGDVVTSMVGYVPMHDILNKIISDHGNHEFGDFKTTILEMLTCYGYELAILGTARNIIDADMFHNVVALRKGRARGFSPKTAACCVCNNKASAGAGARHIFSCGHLAHLDCLVNAAESQLLPCPACSVEEKVVPTTSSFSISQKQKGKSVDDSELRDEKNEVQTVAEVASETSRFDLLKRLQKGLPDMLDEGPRLRLAPPPPQNKHLAAGAPSAAAAAATSSSRKQPKGAVIGRQLRHNKQQQQPQSWKTRSMFQIGR